MHIMTFLGKPEGARLRDYGGRKSSWSRSWLRKGRDLLVRAPLLTSLLSIFTTAAHCQTTMDPASFAGKQIKLLIGYSPTGYGYDTYGRLLARHLGKYLPGDPLIIPQNRPGAGSLNLANYLYNAAPKDFLGAWITGDRLEPSAKERIERDGEGVLVAASAG